MSVSAAAGGPLVTVVVGVYNGERFLAEQLKSLTAQTHRNLEILVLDDASTDRSGQIAQEQADTDPRIRMVRQERNLGLVSNFLSGAEIASGDYVCFCDQDDVWRFDKIEVLLRMLDAHPQRALAYSDLDICDPALESTGRSFWSASQVRPRSGVFVELALLRNLVPGCAMIFRRSVAQRLATVLQDEAFRRHHESCRLTEAWFMHDHLAFLAAALDGGVEAVGARLVRYRQHASNAVGAAGLPSPGREVTAARMLTQASLLERLGWIQDPKILNRFKTFGESLAGRRPLAARIGVIDFYWRLRSDSLKEKWLGVLECVWPRGYDRIKRRVK